ncbi:hypothetical protein [Novosphingobium sp. Gsoil 351]|uniref:hypothetical protein n=1 Tax=Novosphingobium sp. Gsoil 351 TaxID=2675225 RepID=UPI0012B4785D|nr:hypothetical protein [Novosphingobium sp. Gsoil 351]QGN54323.1 hypothetical protein GKE62_06905 [Novosphingobium sp. Gsoil 351]
MYFKVAAGIALALAAQPAAAEVVASSEAGFVTRATAEVPADPGATWQKLIAPQTWWNRAHTFSGDSANLYLDAQGGGCFCEKLPLKDGAPGARAGSVAHMRVVYAEPGKALRMVGSLGPLQSEALTGTLTITLKPGGTGTRIVMEYIVGGYMRYKTAEIAPAVDNVLAEQLASLAAALGSVPDAAGPEAKPKPKPKAKPKP